MTRCDECGARNGENATFCVRCGAELPHAEARPVGDDTDKLDPVEPLDAADDAAPEHEPQQVEAEEDEWEIAEEVPAAPEDVDEGAERLLREAGDLLADGDPDNAAAKCREAIEIAPDLVAAYSLLGMAEEERGNTTAAAGAYRRVLQLDPERRVEREKLEALYATGAAERHEGAEEGGAESPVIRWAPWIAAVGAAFAVLTLLTFVGLRVHAANEAERIYTEQMQTAQSALDSGDYETAVDAFEMALAARPENTDAKRGLGYARRKMNADNRTRTVQAPAQTSTGPYRADIVPPSGPNPFTPIPIGSSDEQETEPEPQPGQPPRTQTQRQSNQRTTPPPVMPEDERVEIGPRQEGSQPDEESGPLEFHRTPDEQQAEAEGAEADRSAPPEDAGEPEEPEGECTIWRSPPSAASEEASEAPAPDAPDNSHAQRALALRRQAKSAMGQGNCDRAGELAGEAIEQLQADSEQNPHRREANRVSITTLQKFQQRCEAGDSP